MNEAGQQVIQTSDLRAFFRDSLHEALRHQALSTSEETVAYLVNLLTNFSHSDKLYERTEDGYMLRPLAIVLGEAMQAEHLQQRNAALRRVGDVSLFVAGLFASSLRRKVVNMDYYVSMGGTAYGCLSESAGPASPAPGWQAVFEELSSRFVDFVDVLNEVGDAAGQDSDVLQLYETWLHTGSRRAASRLRRLGVEVSVNAASTRTH